MGICKLFVEIGISCDAEGKDSFYSTKIAIGKNSDVGIGLIKLVRTESRKSQRLGGKLEQRPKRENVGRQAILRTLDRNSEAASSEACRSESS